MAKNQIITAIDIGTTKISTLIASIGPITSQAVKEAGLKVHIEAKEYTLEGLARAIVKYYD